MKTVIFLLSFLSFNITYARQIDVNVDQKKRQFLVTEFLKTAKNPKTQVHKELKDHSYLDLKELDSSLIAVTFVSGFTYVGKESSSGEYWPSESDSIYMLTIAYSTSGRGATQHSLHFYCKTSSQETTDFKFKSKTRCGTKSQFPDLEQ